MGQSTQSLQNNSNNIQQLITAMKNSGNPAQFVENYIRSNPLGQQIINLSQQNKMTPKEMFYKVAQQKGVDPNQILNMFK